MNNASEIFFPPFRLDLLREKLWRGGEVISLRPKTFAIFRYLAEHPERLVSKAELLRTIWGDTHVSEEGLRDYIREIRKALSDNPDSPRFVETVLGRGYRFIGKTVSNQSSIESREKKEQQLQKMRPLLTVRGVYDGKVIKVLPTELLPLVARKVPVAILFLEDTQTSPEENETPERYPFIFNERIVLSGHLKNSLEEE